MLKIQYIERKGKHLGLGTICTHQRKRVRWIYECFTMAHVSVEPVLYMFDVFTSVVFFLLLLIFSRWYHLCSYQWSFWERLGEHIFQMHWECGKKHITDMKAFRSPQCNIKHTAGGVQPWMADYWNITVL